MRFKVRFLPIWWSRKRVESWAGYLSTQEVTGGPQWYAPGLKEILVHYWQRSRLCILRNSSRQGKVGNLSPFAAVIEVLDHFSPHLVFFLFSLILNM